MRPMNPPMDPMSSPWAPWAPRGPWAQCNGPYETRQNCTETRSWKSLSFESILALVFHWFLFDFACQLGAMLATFSSKCGRLFPSAPRLLLGLCSFSFFWPSSLLAPFGLDLGGLGLGTGRCWPRFCKFLATVWAYDSSWKTCSFDPFCWRLVLDGLVGLREAQRFVLFLFSNT